jgi:hypothetical protein
LSMNGTLVYRHGGELTVVLQEIPRVCRFLKHGGFCPVEYVGVQARLNQHFVPPFLFANGHAYSEAGHGFVSDWEAWN